MVITQQNSNGNGNGNGLSTGQRINNALDNNYTPDADTGLLPYKHCLQNYIGLAGCGIDTPDSAAYLNELPGISLKTIDNIADAEQINFNGVWADMQRRALRKFDTDVQNYLSKRYKLNTPLETLNLGKQVNPDPDVQTPMRLYRQGLHITIEHGSALQVLHVQEISLYSLTTHNNLQVSFFEKGDDGLFYLIDLRVMKVTANQWNTLYIGRDYNVRQLYISFPANEVVTPQTLLNTAKTHACCQLSVSGCQQVVDTADQPVVDVANSFGLTAVLSTRCNWQAYVCNNKSLFTQSLLLLYGIELMNERIHSPRLNQYTLFGADKARQLRDEMVVQYQQELENVLSTLTFGSDCCVECNGQLTFKHRLP